MAALKLASIRIGFAYAVDLNFPAGFLEAEESIRARLRKYPGAPDPVTFDSERVGDSVTISLTAEQTSTLLPGSYITEAVVYQPLSPGVDEQPLADNVYLIDADYSPSE